LAFADGLAHLLTHFQTSLLETLTVGKQDFFHYRLVSDFQQGLSPTTWQNQQAHEAHLLIAVKPSADSMSTGLIELGQLRDATTLVTE
jgi:hypothetical protein